MRLSIPLSHEPVPLAYNGVEQACHVFEPEVIMAVNAALAAKRPLLVRGEPGVGKSQLARAAAKALHWPCISTVLHARYEVQELFYEVDAVERLAQAQMMGALSGMNMSEVRAALDIRNFVAPGPLWWAFDWDEAEQQAKRRQGRVPPRPEGWKPKDGVVVLLDEIDKADSSLPNGMLEALGGGTFSAPVSSGWVQRNPEVPLLMVVSTNEERMLPDAFVRRCLVLHLRLPSGEEELVRLLLKRGEAHFPRVDKDVLNEAARQLAKDRQHYQTEGLLPPGQAEYFDLVRAVVNIGEDTKEQRELLKKLAKYTYKKHRDERV